MTRLLLIAITLALLPFSGSAQQRISDGDFVFAQVAPFENGPVEAATAMQAGIRAAFDEANRNGGIGGHRVHLESIDDSYQPDRTITVMRRLIAEDRHIGLIGMYGTATGAASQPLATEAGWPFIGALTGADFLRDPELDNVFNVRETYANEMAAGTAHVVDVLGLTKIAVLYQDDGLGRAGRAGVLRALEERGLEPVAEAPYVRKTTAVKVGLLNVRKAGAEAVMMIALNGAATVFIQTAERLDYKPLFVSGSIVGSAQLAEKLGKSAKGILVTQVVPSPHDATLPIAAQYQAAMTAFDPDEPFGYLSFEGYIAGRVALRALQDAGPNPTRADLILALHGLGSLDLGGIQVTYGSDEKQGLCSVFLTEMDGSGGYTMVDTAAVASGS